jgi:hypothetical protein
MKPMDEGLVSVSEGRGHAVELRKEAYTMALYVSICLLAALIALPESQVTRGQVIGIIWGVTVGLAAAHWFAFRVSARLVGDGSIREHDLELAAAQLAGAAAVALLVSIPVLILPPSVELQFAQFELAAFIALVGYAVARRGGARRARAFAYSLAMLAVGVGIAALKNVLAGH